MKERIPTSLLSLFCSIFILPFSFLENNGCPFSLPLGFEALLLDKLFATNLLFCSSYNIILLVYNIPGSVN